MGKLKRKNRKLRKRVKRMQRNMKLSHDLIAQLRRRLRVQQVSQWIGPAMRHVSWTSGWMQLKPRPVSQWDTANSSGRTMKDVRR